MPPAHQAVCTLSSSLKKIKILSSPPPLSLSPLLSFHPSSSPRLTLLHLPSTSDRALRKAMDTLGHDDCGADGLSRRSGSVHRRWEGMTTSAIATMGRARRIRQRQRQLGWIQWALPLLRASRRLLPPPRARMDQAGWVLPLCVDPAASPLPSHMVGRERQPRWHGEPTKSADDTSGRVDLAGSPPLVWIMSPLLPCTWIQWAGPSPSTWILPPLPPLHRAWIRRCASTARRRNNDYGNGGRESLLDFLAAATGGAMGDMETGNGIGGGNDDDRCHTLKFTSQA